MLAETQAVYAFHLSVYEDILTPHQLARMHARAQPWWADELAIIQVLGAFASYGDAACHVADMTQCVSFTAVVRAVMAEAWHRA